MLQKFNPLIVIWQFVFDEIFFGQPYTTIQYIGYGILFGLYLLQTLVWYFFDRKKEVAKDQ